MNLFKAAIDTYDSMESAFAGKYFEKKEPLAPVGHITKSAQIEITLDANGYFYKAAKVDMKIIIPVTEKSSGKTSAVSPHPLCEELSYLLDINEEKRNAYIEQLRKWEKSEFGSKKLSAILQYVERNTITDDLKNAGLLKYDKGKIKNEKDLVCWVVNGLGEQSGKVWTDIPLMKKYANYYIHLHESEDKVKCMISGEEAVSAKQHIKGIVSFHGNAKLISSNDESNYTYRGRFLSDSEALTIGYIASQKAHNALKWLLSNQKASMGKDRVIVCWNPKGHNVPSPVFPFDDSKKEEKSITETNYKSRLSKVVQGFKSSLPSNEGVCIAAFDASTKGRLSVAYYNELAGSDYIDRLAYWDETCCWNHSSYGIYAPNIPSIVDFAFGFPRKDSKSSKEKVKAESVKAETKLKDKYMHRLILCRVEKQSMPFDIVQTLVSKAVHLQNYDNSNREKLLFIVCAVIRKYIHDIKKEDIEMSLDPNKLDRSYQFGRLLAVMEKIERDTYEEADDNREPNAIRMQSMFVMRPAYASEKILTTLKTGYYPRLKPSWRMFYEKLIGEIMEQILMFGDAEYGKKLSETYLPGYYLQKNALYMKKNQNEEVEEI